MRQIEGITTAIAELIFNKPLSRYEMQREVRQLESDLLYVLLCKMIDDRKINDAENLLFDMLEVNNQDHLAIATDFYNSLSNLTDKELKASDFSKDEISNGINEIKTLFGLNSEYGYDRVRKAST